MSWSPPRELLAIELLGRGSVPVVLLHGLGADHRQPSALLTEQLLNAGRYMASDLRGHGRTTLPCGVEDMSFARMAKDVEETLETVRPGAPIVLVGISMGAAIACELLARGCVQTRGLVLIRPAWQWDPAPPNLSAFPLIARLLKTLPPAEARARFEASSEFVTVKAVSPAAAGALLAQFDDPSARARVGRLQGLPADAPKRPDTNLRHTPAVVIGSGLDPVHPLALAESLSADLQLPFLEVSPRYESPDAHARQVAHAIERVVGET